MMSRNY